MDGIGTAPSVGWRAVGVIVGTRRLSILVAALVAVPAAFFLWDDLRTVVFGSPTGRVAFLAVLTGAGALVGAGIGRFVDTLRTEVFVDALTRLYNRRFLDAQLDLLDAKARRYGRHYSVVAFDLDGLKTVNDTYGHAVGDAAIRTFAAILSGALRRSDLAIRTGGDEFVVILPETPCQDVRIVFDRIRSRLAEARVRDPRLAITVSAGAVGWRSERAVAALVRDADQLLYAAKRAGRDRIELEPAAT